MIKITDWQLYCILCLSVIPVAILEQPNRLIDIAWNNAWLVCLPALLTGILLIKMYDLIIRRSREPFPVLLYEHFGAIAGRALGFIYIFIFILTCAFNLRIFLEFMKMMVLPFTPVSIFIGAILFTGFFAIKAGLTGLARFNEYLFVWAILLIGLIIIIPLAGNFHLERIRPIGYISYKNFGLGVLVVTTILGKMMPVLSLAYFLPIRERAGRVMFFALITYVALVSFTAFAVVVVLGTYPASNYVFPTFSMIRLAQIGNFLQNLDIVFVAILIQGVSGSLLVSWWMACFTTQKVFGLQDYRFIAAPTSLIIGVLSLIISRSNLEVITWSLYIMPVVFAIFSIVIPFFTFLICLFKPDVHAPDATGSGESLHKGEVAG